MKILIVDDDKISLMLMVQFLNRFGTCDTVADGIEAVEAVIRAHSQGSGYQLVILDIMMPNMNGMETLQKIRAYEEQIGVPAEKAAKAIMVSALSGDVVRIEAYEKGCTAYLRKPINFQQLERVIRDELSIDL